MLIYRQFDLAYYGSLLWTFWLFWLNYGLFWLILSVLVVQPIFVSL